VAQTPGAVLAKKRWDATVHGVGPAPGWTTRLRDLGQPLPISAVAVGRILELMGFRSGKQVSDHAVTAGYGVRWWDGFCFHSDWHRDRLVEAIRSAALCRDNAVIADCVATAVAKQRAKELSAERRRRHEEAEAVQRRRREAEMCGLKPS
jgi:hypothetical protein